MGSTHVAFQSFCAIFRRTGKTMDFILWTKLCYGNRKGAKAIKLIIGHLYPDLLNLYGDRGNIQCFQKRLSWRGIEPEVRAICAGDKIDFTQFDIVLLGGGSDREQEIVCHWLNKVKRSFRAYVEDGGVTLAICGGYQLLGNYYKTSQQTIEGLGILDIYTQWEAKRLTGDVVLKSDRFTNPIVGFENHSGRTYIGDYNAFGSVVRGFGNTGQSGQEGVLYKNCIGTYLHGPLLPKNPEICDFLLTQALRRKYRGDITLEPLGDELEHRANQYICEKVR